MRKNTKLITKIAFQILVVVIALGWFRQIALGGLARSVNAVVCRPYLQAKQASQYVLGGWLSGWWEPMRQLTAGIRWPMTYAQLGQSQLHRAVGRLQLMNVFDISGHRLALPLAPHPRLNAVIVDERWNTEIPNGSCDLEIHYSVGSRHFSYDTALPDILPKNQAPLLVGPHISGGVSVLWHGRWRRRTSPHAAHESLTERKWVWRSAEFFAPPDSGTIHVSVFVGRRRQIPKVIQWVAGTNHPGAEFTISQTQHNVPVLRSISVNWYATGEGINGGDPLERLGSSAYDRLSEKVLLAAGAMRWCVPGIVASIIPRIEALSPEDAMLASQGIVMKASHQGRRGNTRLLAALAAAGKVSSLSYPLGCTLVESDWNGRRLYVISGAGSAGGRPEVVGEQDCVLFSKRGMLLASVAMVNIPGSWQWERGTLMAAAELGLYPRPHDAGRSSVDKIKSTAPAQYLILHRSKGVTQ